MPQRQATKEAYLHAALVDGSVVDQRACDLKHKQHDQQRQWRRDPDGQRLLHLRVSTVRIREEARWDAGELAPESSSSSLAAKPSGSGRSRSRSSLSGVPLS